MSTLATDPPIVQPAVIPWYAEKASFPPDVISLLYQRLAQEDVLADLSPERHTTESEFEEFVNGPALLSIFLDLKSGRYAGLAWITNVEEGDLVKKGCASVAFFKEWQKPKITEVFGRICLGHWFHIQQFDLVYVLTPADNTAAIRYVMRLGFKYRATLPNFTSRRGVRMDARIATMSRDEFHSRE